MPTDPLSPVAGDPSAIAHAATTLESIAADVDATSARLRLLTAGRGSWSGVAAIHAQARTITLPPKLEKVRNSYSTAGRALHTYADALADAQARSASAVRAATLAQTDLQQARSAYDAAARHDADALRTAAAAGVPPPSATAPRFEQAITDAEGQLRRANAANAQAHEKQEQAARHAAAALKQASREGIRNKPWWRHILSNTAHWAHAAWTHGLRFVSKVAVTVSALAGLAALAFAVAGVVFPPFEAAAGTLETISFASATVALAADAGLAMTGDASWIGVGIDALALVPAIGSAGVRRLAPVLRKTKLIRALAQGGAARMTRADEAIEAATSADAEPVTLPTAESWKAPATLADHVARHGPDFGIASADEYAQRASQFFQEGIAKRIPTKIAEKDGTIRMYDRASNTFGSYHPDGTAKTLYKPDPARHHRPDNWTYWLEQPGKEAWYGDE